MLVAIHQPHYLPWLGYLQRMRQADLFIDLKDLQSKVGRDPAERAAREPGERALRIRDTNSALRRPQCQAAR